MTDDQLSENLVQFLAAHFSLELTEFNSSTLLFSDGLLDSFSMVEVVSWLEDTSGIKFGVMDINLQNLDSVQKMVNYVKSKQS